MSIRDDVAATLPQLRVEAESLMRDRCMVKRATGATTTDPVTLEEVPVYAVVLSGVACKIKFPPTQPHVVAVPGVSVVETSIECHMPI